MKVLKVLAIVVGGFIGFIFFMSVAFAIISPDSKGGCYFGTSIDNYDYLLIGNVAEDIVEGKALYDGASADGYCDSVTEYESGDVAVCYVELNARNGFGVYSRTWYKVEMRLNCDGYTLLSVEPSTD